MYCDCNGKIFNALKYSLQESLALAPRLIVIILFCSLKIVLLYEEFHPQNYSIIRDGVKICIVYHFQNSERHKSFKHSNSKICCT